MVLDDANEKLPAFMTFRTASKVKFQDVWDIIEAVLQSEPEALSSGKLTMVVTSVKTPMGPGGTFHDDYKKKRSIVTVDNEDNFCLPRALVVGKSFAKNYPKYGDIRPRRIADGKGAKVDEEC